MRRPLLAHTTKIEPSRRPIQVVEWACPEHPEQRAEQAGLCWCGYAMIPVEDIVDRQD